MRVFDFEGVVEGVTELIESLDGVQEKEEEEEEDDHVAFRGTVGDSQYERDEMLDLTSIMVDEHEQGEETNVTEEADEGTKENEEKATGMVLINNLSQVLNLLLKHNYAQGMTRKAEKKRRRIGGGKKT
jgi:hypothetical protein